MTTTNDAEANLSTLTVVQLEARLLEFCPQELAMVKKARIPRKADLARVLAAYHKDHPRAVTCCRAPLLPDKDHRQLLQILKSIKWRRYEVKGRKYYKNGALKVQGGSQNGKGVRTTAVGSQNFVLGTSLGPLGSGGFEKKGPKKGLGKNTTIIKSRQEPDAKACMQLWRTMKRLVKAADPGFVFTSMQVNRNFLGRPHCDSKDRSYQYAVSLGSFNGGNLMVETDDPEQLAMFDTKGRLTKCDGRRPHWVTPYEGERYSIIMYRCLGRKTPVLSNRKGDTNARP